MAKAKAPKERKATKKEQEAVERGRRLAASYLTQRDGMDEDTAAMVVASMDADTINNLIAEANSTVMDRIKQSDKVDGAVSNLVQGEEDKAAKAAEPEKQFVPLTEVPGLLALTDIEVAGETYSGFGALAETAKEASTLKNVSEKMYKAIKAKMVKLMDFCGAPYVQYGEWRLERYRGGTSFLDPIKLMEKGVDPEVINACYSKTEYDDVRFSPAPKGGA